MNENGQTEDRGARPRRLTRSRDDRFVGGVAAGLAGYFNIDPVLVRVAFVVSLAIGGVGVLAYLVLLAALPLEGDPDQPVPPVTGQRRKLAIGGTVLVGVLLLVASASGGSGTSWLFGFGPGVLFGILLWVLVAAALVWALRRAGTIQGPGAAGPVAGSPATSAAPPASASPSPSTPASSASPSTPASPSPPAPPASPASPSTPAPLSPPASPASPSTPAPPTSSVASVPPTPADGSRSEPGAVAAGFAASPSQIGPDEVTEVLDEGPTAERPVAGTGGGSGAPSAFGRVMTWIAIGLAGLVVLSIIAAISFGATALFGAIPAAVMVMLCGAGVVGLALTNRPQLALWTVAAAFAIAVPMAVVAIASLDIEGGWGEINEGPAAAFEIPTDGYKMAGGALKVDLRGFPFRKGETLDLTTRSGFGATSVIVPDNVCVVGDIEGKIGYIDMRGSESQGAEPDRRLPEPTANVPVLKLDSEFRLGYFGVFDDSGWRGKGDNWPDDLETYRPAAVERATAACLGTAASGAGDPGADGPNDGSGRGGSGGGNRPGGGASKAAGASTLEARANSASGFGGPAFE